MPECRANGIRPNKKHRRNNYRYIQRKQPQKNQRSRRNKNYLMENFLEDIIKGSADLLLNNALSCQIIPRRSVLRPTPQGTEEACHREPQAQKRHPRGPQPSNWLHLDRASFTMTIRLCQRNSSCWHREARWRLFGSSEKKYRRGSGGSEQLG